jgi:hypothetical protein
MTYRDIPIETKPPDWPYVPRGELIPIRRSGGARSFPIPPRIQPTAKKAPAEADASCEKPAQGEVRASRVCRQGGADTNKTHEQGIPSGEQ